MSDFYLRKYDYHRYYPYIGIRVRGILHGIAVFKEYWYGRRVDRLYTPSQPRTSKQQGNRFLFYQGLQYWAGFDSATKNFYAKDAIPYKLYGIHRWLTKYLNQATPMIIYWNPLEKEAGNNQSITAAIAAAITAAKLAMFPVGTIYTNIDGTDPGTFLGGTWAAFGAGKVLVGLKGADTDFDVAEETGGAKTVSAIVGNHAAKNTDATASAAQAKGSSTATLALNTHVHNISLYTHAITASSVVQPYIVVYFWKRTA